MKKLSTEERERRHKAAARATVIGTAAAAAEFGLPAWAVYQALGEIGRRTATPHYQRDERRAIAEESGTQGKEATAEKYGITLNTLGKWRSEFGMAGRLTRKQVLEAVAMMRRGERIAAIAHRFAVSRNVLDVIRREAIEVGLIDPDPKLLTPPTGSTTQPR